MIMQTHSRSPFLTIHTEGALLPADLLQRVLGNDKDLGGLTPSDYHLPPGEKLNEAINRSWNRLQGAWAAFQTSRGRLKEGDPGTTLTRERWLLPLFQELGYGRLVTTKAVEIEGKSYAISHGWANVPIHLVGCGVDLDRRTAGVSGASKSSPHSLVQELLNRAEDRQWGLLSNGLRLRILRDNAALTRQAYLEFDLEAMFGGEIYADFVLLWLVCHQSRVEEIQVDRASTYWLEKWSKAAQERGTRALDRLRDGVEEAIARLGSGFLAHPANTVLRARLRSGALPAHDYYRQLLRMVYRLIFLFVAEDRDLLLAPNAELPARERYLRYYSTARLRRLAERQRGGLHTDLWQGLRLITDLLGGREAFAGAGAGLGLPVLNGFLFSEQALPDLETSQVDNQSLLTAVRSLAFTIEKNVRRAVDYRNLGVRELGSVYESLLELHPQVNTEAGTFVLSGASGSERKTTGSYYTNADLVETLLDSALNPVIDQTLETARRQAAEQQIDFATLAITLLLALKICDPACGSGHFLIAAAHRIARQVALLRSGGDEPTPQVYRQALREVIAHCIYGVDINPMAVELCKINLWMESLEPGKPLSFLDAHIQCGNSLLGVGPGLDISEIPDDAFNPVFSDDKATAAALKKRNKRERGGQLGFRWQMTELKSAEDMALWRAERLGQVDAMPEEKAAQVQAKAQAFVEYKQTQEYIQNRLEYDLWTAAFFWPISKCDAEQMSAPTQQELLTLRTGGKLDVQLVERVREMAEHLNFFHWELAFPQVFARENSGFDCLVGNPPWERIKLQEEEFFASRDSEIASAPTTAARRKLIEALVKNKLPLADRFTEAKHATECSSKFSRQSGRFPLTAVGDVNTYALFTEHNKNLLSKTGRVGIIVPTGIATTDTTKQLFDKIVKQGSLVSLFDFVEARDFFTGLESRDPFCLLTLRGGTIPLYDGVTEFVFKMLSISEKSNKLRKIKLSQGDFELLNPNTRTCPKFYTHIDAELTRKIYRQTPILIKEVMDENPWGASFLRMIDMSNDSSLFMDNESFNVLPLYEAKLFHQYDHRWATFDSETQRNLTEEEKQNFSFFVKPRYWICGDEVQARLYGKWHRKWLIGFRNNARENDERTAIFGVIPLAGVGNSAPLLLITEENISTAPCLIANTACLVFDYITRQKIGGANFNFFIIKQLPVLPPDRYTPKDISLITSNVLELVYTAYDLRPFAEDMSYYGEPFRWDKSRRAILRAELDTYYARLYKLNRKQLRYILDPADLTQRELEDILDPWEEVADPLDPQGYAQRAAASDFPGETFRVLKEKEIKQFGEYRTRRLVLEAWDRLEKVEVASVQPAAEIEKPATLEIPVPAKPVTAPPVQEKKPRAVKEKPVKEAKAVTEQSSFTDFGLYQCGICEKMVMGYDRENHTRQEHKGKGAEWKKVK